MRLQSILMCMLMKLDQWDNHWMYLQRPKSRQSLFFYFIFFFWNTKNQDFANLGSLKSIKYHFLASQNWHKLDFWLFCERDSLDVVTQCGNLAIFLALWFYVKSNLAILRAQKLQFWSFRRLWILIFKIIPHLRLLKFLKNLTCCKLLKWSNW